VLQPKSKIHKDKTCISVYTLHLNNGYRKAPVKSTSR